jgi:hypothetical protein
MENYIQKMENFHSMNICYLHIGQWLSKFFIPKSKSYMDA